MWALGEGGTSKDCMDYFIHHKSIWKRKKNIYDNIYQMQSIIYETWKIWTAKSKRFKHWLWILVMYSLKKIRMKAIQTNYLQTVWNIKICLHSGDEKEIKIKMPGIYQERLKFKIIIKVLREPYWRILQIWSILKTDNGRRCILEKNYNSRSKVKRQN